MSDDELDPVIHAPARLRIAVTLAALNEGDNLSFTRLQELIGLTPGNLITHLRKLEDAGYVTTHKNGSGVTARTSVALTLQRPGRPGPLHHGAAPASRLGPAGLTPIMKRLRLGPRATFPVEPDRLSPGKVAQPGSGGSRR